MNQSVVGRKGHNIATLNAVSLSSNGLLGGPPGIIVPFAVDVLSAGYGGPVLHLASVFHHDLSSTAVVA